MNKFARTKKERLQELLKVLYNIEELVNRVDKLDPYGDMRENFEDIDGGLVTKRLMKMIEEDLEEL